MSDEARTNALRGLPSVDRLVDACLAGENGTSRALLADSARHAIDEARSAILRGEASAPPPMEEMVDRVAREVARRRAPVLAPVINATGVLLHTGLGRAPLGPALAGAAATLEGRYAPVELDMQTGRRGKRRRVVEPLLRELTGAEAAMVVNNNAAAMVVTLAAIAGGREVIVSRGELVEIGGSFRLPEIIETGGAILREVGTTNRTRPEDYDRAVTDRTAALMKVHPSNYAIAGFSHEASIEAIAEVGRRRDLPVIHDIGSGLLTEALREAFGIDEPSAEHSLKAGADLVLFSGDKLLGGPQAGIVVGRAALIDRIERHPLMRAVRVDKLTLSVLAETLARLRDPDRWEEALPVLAMVRRTIDALREDATKLAAALDGVPATLEIVESEAFVGGGSAPGQGIPSISLRVRPTSISEGELATRLREGDPGVIGRVHDGTVSLDMRSIGPDEASTLARCVRRALGAP